MYATLKSGCRRGPIAGWLPTCHVDLSSLITRSLCSMGGASLVSAADGGMPRNAGLVSNVSGVVATCFFHTGLMNEGRVLEQRGKAPHFVTLTVTVRNM